MKLLVKNLSWKCLRSVQSAIYGITKVNIALCTFLKTGGAKDSINKINRNNKTTNNFLIS